MHPAHAEDAAAAWAWVVRNISKYGGDPERVFLSGHSAGGYLAALLSVDPSYLGRHGLKLSSIRGTIPVSAFLYVEETARDRPKTVWGQDPKVWLQASVSPYLSSGKPPMLLIFADGDADWRKEQNRRFRQALMDSGNAPAGLIEVPDRIHMTLWTRISEAGDPASQAILDFIAENP